MLSAAPGAWAAATASFTASATNVLPGQPVTFTSTSVPDATPITQYTWTFGDGSPPVNFFPTETEPDPPPVQHAFAAGVWNVRLTVFDAEGPVISAPTVIRANTPPRPDFVVFPGAGMTGQALDFVSVSTDPDTQGFAALDWNFGDGSPPVSGNHVQHAFRQPGTHTVTLTATDTLGGFNSTQKPVPVTSPPSLRAPETRQPAEAEAPRPLTPFPVVRLVGDLTDTGAHIRLLSVRAPRRSAITIRCRGGNCPKRIRTRSRGKTLRFKKYHRRNLRARARIEVLVARKGRIGKYTRFRIRRGKSPKRMDRCLMPGARKGTRCPGD